jgi:XRE family aerobic/anaerobic benzoate catabolism transcriptional regulator
MRAMPRKKKKSRTADAAAATYLKGLGERIRAGRAQHGMVRHSLAKHSGVSQRFLAQLEAGEGNPSIIVLRQVAHAIGMSAPDLVADVEPRPIDQALIVQTLNRLSAPELSEVRQMLVARFARKRIHKENYVSLIGLRGAGKSTLGAALAGHLNAPFIVLDREVEREYGATIGQILDFHGQSGYLRYERQCLEKILGGHDKAVIEIGGGLATDTEALDLLLETTLTVWVKAAPEEHMQRVIEQGDLRPMAQSKEAMADLRAILKAREPFYRKAALHLNTSKKTPAQSVKALLKLLQA